MQSVHCGGVLEVEMHGVAAYCPDSQSAHFSHNVSVATLPAVRVIQYARGKRSGCVRGYACIFMYMHVVHLGCRLAVRVRLSGSTTNFYLKDQLKTPVAVGSLALTSTLNRGIGTSLNVHISPTYSPCSHVLHTRHSSPGTSLNVSPCEQGLQLLSPVSVPVCTTKRPECVISIN
jgi:hypothetical protein